MDYSIVIPVYFNEGNLHLTFKTIKETVIDRNSELKGEIIFVDDGSKDNSFKELIEIKEANPILVKLIKFTRNFGQPYARTAGFNIAKGKCLIQISADLQDPPELINQMLKYHFEDKYEIVICTRIGRDESYFRKVTSNFFYSIMRKMSFPNMPKGGFDFVLTSRKVWDVISSKQEANSFYQGQILWTGFDIKYIPYMRKMREIGKSKWTFKKKVKLLIDGVLGYSYFPLRMMSIIGFLVAFTGFIYATVILINRFLGETPVKGFASTMIVVLILSGIQMLMLGVIGEYLWRTLDQVRNRHPYIIEKIYD